MGDRSFSCAVSDVFLHPLNLHLNFSLLTDLFTLQAFTGSIVERDDNLLPIQPPGSSSLAKVSYFLFLPLILSLSLSLQKSALTCSLRPCLVGFTCKRKKNLRGNLANLKN